MTWPSRQRMLTEWIPSLLQCRGPTVNLLELKHNLIKKSKKNPNVIEYMIRIIIIWPSLSNRNKFHVLLSNGIGGGEHSDFIGKLSNKLELEFHKSKFFSCEVSTNYMWFPVPIKFQSWAYSQIILFSILCIPTLVIILAVSWFTSPNIPLNISTVRWFQSLSFMMLKVKVSVAWSCPTLCDPMDCSPPN